MAQAPMMPVWTDALIGDTTHLSAEEFGAYCLILIATWRNNGQALADDDRRMARVCRVNIWRWQRVLRPSLIEFFDLSDGRWHQKRLEKEWKNHMQRVENARNVRKAQRGNLPKATGAFQRNQLKTNETTTTNHIHNLKKEENIYIYDYKNTARARDVGGLQTASKYDVILEITRQAALQCERERLRTEAQRSRRESRRRRNAAAGERLWRRPATLETERPGMD